MPIAGIEGGIYYAARGGSGPPVLLLHGAGGTHLVWNAQLGPLSERARVWAPDLPGHGRSGEQGRTSIRGYADCVCSLLDALGLERAVIVGTSMGGAIAQTLALENPDRVLGLGLVGSGARLRVLPAFLEGLLTDFPRTAREINEAEFAPEADATLKQLSEQRLLECPPRVVHDDFAACNAFDVISRLSEIRRPTFVMCGSLDRMTPVKYSEYLAARIPGARLEIIPGAGHMVMVERPDEVNRSLGGWLRDLHEAS